MKSEHVEASNESGARVGQWVSRSRRRLARFLFGDDVFISYSRRDGIRYATALARELTRRELACRIDFLETVPGNEIPAQLRNALLRSGLLAIVGSPGACDSPQVESEVREFLQTKRNLVPIGFGQTVQQARWFPLVSGLTVEEDPESRALETGTPAESVLKRIEDSCDFVKRNRRLRNLFSTTLVGTVLLVIFAGAWIVWSRAQVRDAEKRATEADTRASKADERTLQATEETDRQTRLATAEAGAAELDGYISQRGYTPAFALPRSIQIARELVLLGRSVEAGSVLSRTFSSIPQVQALTRVESGFKTPIMSIDGERIAAVVGDRRVVIWESPGLKEFARFSFDSPVSTIVFSPDGRSLAVAAGQAVALFDLPSKSRIAVLRSPAEIKNLRIGPDRRHLAASSEEDIFLWQLSDGDLTDIPAEGRPGKLVFTPDGRQLAILVEPEGSGGDRLYVYDISTETSRLSFDAESLLTLSENGQFVSSSCFEEDVEPAACTTRLWKLPEVVEAGQMPTRDIAIPTLSYDGSFGATSVNDETRVWDTRSGLLLAAIEDSGPVVFSSDGSRVAVAGRRGVTSAYLDGTVAAVLERPGMNPRDGQSPWSLLGLSSRGRHAILANPKSGEIEAWSMDGPDAGLGLLHAGDIVDAASLGEGRLAVRAREDKEFFVVSEPVVLWNLSPGGPISIPTSVMPAVAPDGSVAVVEGDEVRILSGPALSRKSVLGKNPGLRSLTHVPGLGFVGSLVSRGNRSEVELWDVSRGRVLARIPNSLNRSAAFTPEGRFALSVFDSRLRLLDIKAGTTSSFSKEGGSPVAVVCPPAGCLVTLSTGKNLQIWSVDRDEKILEFDGPVGSSAMSRDGTLAAIWKVGVLEIWEIANRKVIARRTVPSLGYMSFDLDGRGLLLGIQRRLERWTWKPEDVIDGACRRIQTNITSQTWKSLLTELPEVCVSN